MQNTTSFFESIHNHFRLSHQACQGDEKAKNAVDKRAHGLYIDFNDYAMEDEI